MKEEGNNFPASMKPFQIRNMLKDTREQTVMSSLIRIWLRWSRRRKQEEKA